jgi:hypothetical protein
MRVFLECLTARHGGHAVDRFVERDNEALSHFAAVEFAPECERLNSCSAQRQRESVYLLADGIAQHHRQLVRGE